MGPAERAPAVREVPDRCGDDGVQRSVRRGQTGVSVCRTADGRLFLAYNNHCRLGDDTLSLIDDRYPLVLAESTDEGKTWRDVLTLDEGPRFEVSYASLIADPDGPLHCVYTWDRRAIKYLSIDVG